jgi:hypothetical protein
LEKQEPTDGDELFLKSLFPEIKQLSDSKKLEFFKMYVHKFFQNESRPQNNYSYQTPVFNPYKNVPYFHIGSQFKFVNSFHSSSPISYKHQQMSSSKISIDTIHHNTYSKLAISKSIFITAFF